MNAPDSRRAARARPAPPADEEPDVDSIVRLTRALVRAPSRAGEDRYDAVLDVMRAWLDDKGLKHSVLKDADGTAVALLGQYGGGKQAPRVLLNATLDTAPFGERGSWRYAPTAARIHDGWLYGRGAADSKCGAALFAHLALSHARASTARSGGRLDLLFDLDEHSGRFSGVKRYVQSRRPAMLPTYALLGYPGNDRIVVGGRGFARARITVCGVAAHSGSSSRRGINAAERAARLVDALAAWQPPMPARGGFPLPPNITVTGLHGGESFSVVPDRCEIAIDVRLTPAFTATRARREVERLVKRVDADRGAAAVSVIDWLPDTWPAYRLKDDSPLVRALTQAASRHFGRDIPAGVAGPSNIGNYLSTLGVQTVAGFGVTARAIHGADECLEIASIAGVWRTYRDALALLLPTDP